MACPALEAAPGSVGRREKHRVVDLLRGAAKHVLRDPRTEPEQRRVLSTILLCRTPALGGKVLVCPDCGREKEVFHSCRNRHCPNCQAGAQDKWIAARAESMLPVPHFHVVFALPAQLRVVCRAYPKAMYDLLLRSSGSVLVELGVDALGAQLGVTTVLHTWSRDLSYHVHAHCLVTAGGWDKDAAAFRPTRRRDYLFPAARLKAMFRVRFLRGLRGLVQQGVVALPNGIDCQRFERTLPPKKRWVVHVQAPIGTFEHALGYLGRYTRRVAISDSRLRAVTDTEVTFATRDSKTCTLSHQEFTRRFLIHVLPPGLKKVRHYGLYAPGSTQRVLALASMASTRALSTPAETNPGSSTEGDPSTMERTAWKELRCPDCDATLWVLRDIPPHAEPRRPP